MMLLRCTKPTKWAPRPSAPPLFCFYYSFSSSVPKTRTNPHLYFPVFCFLIFPVKFGSLMQEVVFSSGGGGGGGVRSSGSMSTLSEEDSSAYPDESELELGLGLSLGGGGAGGGKTAAVGGGGSWDRYARIFNAKASYSAAASSSSSSSSPVEADNNGSFGRSAVSQVVGWPPIRSYRMNSLANHAKSPTMEESASTIDICKSTKEKNVTKESRGVAKTSFFVKVNMDGIPIGRKVDLNAQSCYQTLAHTLDRMFRLSGTRQDQIVNGGAGRPARLLDGSSDFALTYEDKEGDWMLVGDVPWEMFLSSVRRLRIQRTAEANGLSPRSH